ncbi:unnamed protein product [Pelagomonas calceolata]|uniref:Uncharacterized protein n=1 Tax=Pelagomonas calceolata TaxID=35677 RepID=A0A8J2SM42_9STRA|nr:unnamed protein product [Pelagomonas calceolata]
MSLLETAVLAAPVQVVPADDDGARHFRGDDHTLQDASSNRNVAREGALLVDVRALERELGGLEAEADVADIPQTLLALLRERALAAEEHGVLLLVRLLGLIGFPMSLRHICRLSRAASPCGVRPAFEKGECDGCEERVLPRRPLVGWRRVQRHGGPARCSLGGAQAVSERGRLLAPPRLARPRFFLHRWLNHF